MADSTQAIEGPTAPAARLETIDVLQVITSSARRGAERFATALEPELVDRGLSVRTVALTAGQEPALAVDVLGDRPYGPPTLRALRGEMAASRVVVAHGSKSLPATVLAGVGLRRPLVYRSIGDPYYWGTTRLRRARTALLLSRTTAIVSLTAEAARRIASHYRVDEARITPIPRGIPTEHFRYRTADERTQARAGFDIADGDLLAICVGALGPEKDVVNAVEAMAELPDRWRLLIAGDGPERERVERAAAKLDPRRVRLLGQVPDPAELMRAADLLLLPSRTEGLPGVVIEAAMIGVPAVTTDVGFVREIVDDGETGRIVTPGDPKALARAVLDCEARLGPMGQAAHDRIIDDYSMARTADMWYELLEPLVRAGSATRVR